MNDQLTTTSILALFETTKAQRSSFVNDLVNRIMESEADPLKVHLQIKSMEDIITQLTSTDEKKNKNITAALNYRYALLSAAEKHGAKFQLHNADFKISEVGTKYDFSNCGDNELISMYASFETLKAAIKAKEDMIKTFPISGLEQLDKISGELITVYPPTKTSTTSVSVSLK